MQSLYPSHPEEIYQFFANATKTTPSTITFTSEQTTVSCQIPATCSTSPTGQAIDILTDALAVHQFSEDSLTAYMRLHPTMSIDDAHTSLNAAKINYSKLFEPHYIEPYATTPSQGLSIIPFGHFEEFLLTHRDEIITNVHQIIQTDLYNNPPLPKTYEGEFMTVEQYFDALHLTDLDKSFIAENPITELGTRDDDATSRYASCVNDKGYAALEKWLIADGHTDYFQDLIDEGVLTQGVDFHDAISWAQINQIRDQLDKHFSLILQAGLFQQFCRDYNLYALSKYARWTIDSIVDNNENETGRELYTIVEDEMRELVNDPLASSTNMKYQIEDSNQLKAWIENHPDNPAIGMSKETVRELGSLIWGTSTTR